MNFSFRRLFFSEFIGWLLLAVFLLYFLWPLRKKLKYGIDLVGGTYLTLEVQTEKAVETALIERMQNMTSMLKAVQRPVPVTKRVEHEKIILTFNTPQDAQNAASYLKDEMRSLEQSIKENTLELFFSSREAAKIQEEAVRKNIEVLRTRVDKLGVSEIPITAQGEKNIIVELPDVLPQAAKAIIGKAAQLEFKLVEKFIPGKKGDEEIRYEFDGMIPTDKEILPGRDREGFYLVQKYAAVTGKGLKDARPGLAGISGADPVVQFKLTDDAAEKFYELTSKNYGRPLAIVLDGVVISAPRINEAIRGEGIISGNFSRAETNELSLLLKSGSFVAPVTFEQERHIGPSLGEESIRQGLFACLIGLGLLFLFSIFYYKVAGIFAFVALLYNMVLVLVGLAWLKATLTLPGIAGMVLTVGMAIDASVLIFEHIKDELASGASLKNAMNAGFADAMVVILDANITTFIVGVVLYYFGTGPIQGFAVTMMLGIIATLITGLFFLKSIFKLLINNLNVQNLKI